MKTISILVLTATSSAIPACRDPIVPPSGDAGSDAGVGDGSQDEWDQILATRTTDYSAALRIAALRLIGDLPTIDEINSIARAPDDPGKKLAYEALIRDYLGRPAFGRQMFLFWRDTFKIGGTADFDPALDTAPAFAAKLSVTNGSYMDLFTRSSANCPTFDGGSTFTDAECGNGGPQAGVLTNPAIMASYFSNLAFRRVRFVQEIFDCVRFPSEATGTPIDVGGVSLYRSSWPFTSIASPSTSGGRVDFLDVSAAICADCHTTINHRAPLFASYDASGVYRDAIAVPVPVPGAPMAQLNDWLPPGETTAWRYQQPAADLPAFGAAMAADPDVAACGVTRLWNWAFGKTDVVDTLQTVPLETIKAPLDAFTRSGFKMTDLIFDIFDSEDFARF